MGIAAIHNTPVRHCSGKRRAKPLTGKSCQMPCRAGMWRPGHCGIVPNSMLGFQCRLGNHRTPRFEATRSGIPLGSSNNNLHALARAPGRMVAIAPLPSTGKGRQSQLRPVSRRCLPRSDATLGQSLATGGFAACWSQQCGGCAAQYRANSPGCASWDITGMSLGHRTGFPSHRHEIEVFRHIHQHGPGAAICEGKPGESECRTLRPSPSAALNPRAVLGFARGIRAMPWPPWRGAQSPDVRCLPVGTSRRSAFQRGTPRCRSRMRTKPGTGLVWRYRRHDHQRWEPACGMPAHASLHAG
jgi:hypothetical protein